LLGGKRRFFAVAADGVVKPLVGLPCFSRVGVCACSGGSGRRIRPLVYSIRFRSTGGSAKGDLAARDGEPMVPRKAFWHNGQEPGVGNLVGLMIGSKLRERKVAARKEPIPGWRRYRQLERKVPFRSSERGESSHFFSGRHLYDTMMLCAALVMFIGKSTVCGWSTSTVSRRSDSG